MLPSPSKPSCWRIPPDPRQQAGLVSIHLIHSQYALAHLLRFIFPWLGVLSS
jgi:hypothetical protein